MGNTLAGVLSLAEPGLPPHQLCTISAARLSRPVRDRTPPGLQVWHPTVPTDQACRRARVSQGQALKGGREDAASLDRPCARRLQDLRSGRKNARGAGRTKEWTQERWSRGFERT